MKKLLILLSFTITTQAFASPLRSPQLKKIVCENLSEHLFLDDLEFLNQEIVKDCVKTDFNVVDNKTVFNKELKKVISLHVEVDYTTKTGVTFGGSVKLVRAPLFDEKTGYLKVGKWKANNSISYTLDQRAIQPIVEKMADIFNDGIAEATAFNFNIKKYSKKSAYEKIKKIVTEYNDEALKYAEENDYSDGDYCKLYSYEGHAESMNYRINDDYSIKSYMKILEENNFILDSFSYDNEGGESEYCSQYHTEIYFIDGTLLSLFFDWNT